MIEFEHRLPSLNIDGRHNGTYNNHELGMPSVLTTTDHRLGDFLYELRRVVTDDRRLVLVDGRILMCSINWIRDHVHQMKAFKHWEYNLGSFLNFILDTQSEEGFFYELIKQMDDYHWKFVNEDCRVLYPEDNVALVRLEIEADVEYLVVEGAVEYYQVTGDDAWLASALPKLEKAIDYMTSSPKRWDAAHGLVIVGIDGGQPRNESPVQSVELGRPDRGIPREDRVDLRLNHVVHAAHRLVSVHRQLAGTPVVLVQESERQGEERQAVRTMRAVTLQPLDQIR